MALASQIASVVSAVTGLVLVTLALRDDARVGLARELQRAARG